MISKILGFFGGIKTYLIAAAAFALAVGLAVLKGMSIQKNKTKLAQKDIELEATKATYKAEKEGRVKTNENNDDIDSGNWDGFNR